jgi:hypothetical protein
VRGLVYHAAEARSSRLGREGRPLPSRHLAAGKAGAVADRDRGGVGGRAGAGCAPGWRVPERHGGESSVRAVGRSGRTHHAGKP